MRSLYFAKWWENIISTCFTLNCTLVKKIFYLIYFPWKWSNCICLTMCFGISYHISVSISAEYILMLSFQMVLALYQIQSLREKTPIPTFAFLFEPTTSFCLHTINIPFPTETIQKPLASGPSNPIVWRKLRHSISQPLTFLMIEINSYHCLSTYYKASYYAGHVMVHYSFSSQRCEIGIIIFILLLENQSKESLSILPSSPYT